MLFLSPFVSFCSYEVGQEVVKLGGGGSVTRHVAAVAVEHIKIHQIHKGQTLEIPGLQDVYKRQRWEPWQGIPISTAPT